MLSTSRLLLVLCSLAFSQFSFGITRHRKQNDFQAGAAAIEIPVPENISLGGYFERRLWFGSNPKENKFAHHFQASKGQHDAIRAKATVIKVDAKKIALVSLDVVAISPELKVKVTAALTDLGFDETSILLTASHTHSGPAGYIKSSFWEFFAADKYIPAVEQGLVNAVVEAVRRADASTISAQVRIEDSLIPGIGENRRREQVLESELRIIRFETKAGKAIAHWVMVGIHGTLLPPESLILTSDVAGQFERRIDQKFGGISSFLSAPAGDINPTGVERTFEGLDALGEKFISHIARMTVTNAPFTPRELKSFEVLQPLPTPYINTAACSAWLGPLGKLIPRIGLPKEFDQPAKVVGLAMDKNAFVFIPGEPFTDLGKTIVASGREQGFTTVSVVGLTNSYLGYMMNEEEFKTGGYEACNSFYGPTFGTLMTQASMNLLNKMSKGK